MIHLAGDINLTDGFFDTGFGVGTSLMKRNNPYVHLDREAEDVWVGNFEGVCASSSDKEGIYKRQFLIAPQYLAHIKHFDYYGVANNHVMQHGQVAYREMLRNLSELGCGIFGDNIRKSVTFEHQNKKVSILGFSVRTENFSKEYKKNIRRFLIVISKLFIFIGEMNLSTDLMKSKKDLPIGW